MHDGGFDERIARREMPSHEWARENAADLGAISRVTEAEQAPGEAVDIRRDRRWSKAEAFRESAENHLRTALHHLAVTDLGCGGAADEETAPRHAGKALEVVTRRSRANRPTSAPVSR